MNVKVWLGHLLDQGIYTLWRCLLMFCNPLFEDSRRTHIYPMSQKNYTTFIFMKTSANVGQFSYFFAVKFRRSMWSKLELKLPRMQHMHGWGTLRNLSVLQVTITSGYRDVAINAMRPAKQIDKSIQWCQFTAKQPLSSVILWSIGFTDVGYWYTCAQPLTHTPSPIYC